MRPTVLLFDIDGTLIDGAGSGRRAMELGFRAIVGRDDVLHEVAFAGMTDRAIVRAGLRRAGVPDDEATIEAVLVEYLARLPACIEATPFRRLPGVVEVLDGVAVRAEVAIGLGTGNVQAGARCKLATVGLAERFAFGGFGSDAEDRREVIRIGAERGAGLLGRTRAECRVVVIGDTPRDIDAARSIDAECLAVATGPYSRARLEQAGATLAVDDLRSSAAHELLHP